jgi:hypothetical protein
MQRLLPSPCSRQEQNSRRPSRLRFPRAGQCVGRLGPPRFLTLGAWGPGVAAAFGLPANSNGGMALFPPWAVAGPPLSPAAAIRPALGSPRMARQRPQQRALYWFCGQTDDTTATARDTPGCMLRCGPSAPQRSRQRGPAASAIILVGSLQLKWKGPCPPGRIREGRLHPSA